MEYSEEELIRAKEIVKAEARRKEQNQARKNTLNVLHYQLEALKDQDSLIRLEVGTFSKGFRMLMVNGTSDLAKPIKIALETIQTTLKGMKTEDPQ